MTDVAALDKHSCPACGAMANWNAAQRALVCPYCGAVSPGLIESEMFGHERGSFTGAERLHRGFFERAAGGTLFLDEISEMPPELQVRLLRVLETGGLSRVGGERDVPIDVRVIAASNVEPLGSTNPHGSPS